jgi:hypothetical protein
MDKTKQLTDAVLKADSGQRKRLTCAEAFELAEQYDVKVAEIGRICNQNKVKICKCQLGCFR